MCVERDRSISDGRSLRDLMTICIRRIVVEPYARTPRNESTVVCRSGSRISTTLARLPGAARRDARTNGAAADDGRHGAAGIAVRVSLVVRVDGQHDAAMA